MSDWISAKEASRLIREANLSEGDLIEWVRQGVLHARAKSGTFSSDDPFEVRLFPDEPYSDEIKRSTLGPWPDIPAEFWEETPSKTLWGAGTFAGRICYWEGYYQDFAHEHITLFKVTFSKGDLEALLKGPAPSVANAQEPKVKWRRQRVTPRQAGALTFMDIFAKHPPKDPLGPVDFYHSYVAWQADPKNKQEGRPLARSIFAKWEERYRDGWRAVHGRWVHNP